MATNKVNAFILYKSMSHASVKLIEIRLNLLHMKSKSIIPDQYDSVNLLIVVDFRFGMTLINQISTLGTQNTGSMASIFKLYSHKYLQSSNIL